MSNKVSLNVLKERVRFESELNPIFYDIKDIRVDKKLISKDNWYNYVIFYLDCSFISSNSEKEIIGLMVDYGYYNYVIRSYEPKSGLVSLQVEFISSMFPDAEETDFVKGDVE